MRTLASPALAAGPLAVAFVPDDGLLCSSLTHEGEELLGPLGIPFLHPWANRLDRHLFDLAGPRDDNGLPIHGAFPRPWTIRSSSPRQFIAELPFDDPGFPFPHTVRQRVDLDAATLRITTSVRGGRVPIAFGFHPYFALPGAPREDWLVTLPERTRLVADERLIPTGDRVREPAETHPLGTRTFDDGYAELAPARFTLAGGGRTIDVAFTSGYTHAQVYAPAGGEVVCFEPMTAPVNALVTGDGLRIRERFAASFEISVAA
jgi:aldose 1-epimerase